MEKPRKTVRSVLVFQNIRAKRKGKPVCPEKNKSLPVKMPLKNSLLKKGESMAMRVGKELMWVRITKNDLIKTKRAMLFIANGMHFNCLSPTKTPTNKSNTDPHTKIPSTL